MFYRNPQNVYRVETLDRLAWLDYGFGTRLAQSWPPEPYVWVRQIHSDRCVTADGVSGCLGEADCLISATPGTCVTVRTADCIPVLLTDERLRAVAAVHAGWRGTADTIVIKAVDAMRRAFGSRPADLLAAIGPGICGDCYEVGPEVATRLAPWFPERTDLDRKTKVDLAEANRRQLLEAGLAEARVFSGAPCTACHPEEFHSWRRDHIKTGRMVAAVGIRA